VQRGVVNYELTRAAEPYGLHFAPDPSSWKSCTIGGNVAENAGGPHTLAYGVTTNHVTALQLVLPDGEIVRLDGPHGDTPGYELTGLFVGSEGTLALVTEITVKLSREPEAVKTLLAIFDSVDDAADTVVDITARAITPAAREMLDGGTLRAVEDYIHAGFPMDSGAVLLIEVEGLAETVAAQAAAITEVCTAHHAREVRVARDNALTGEHGVGMEKSELMPLLFFDADFDLMRRVHDAFNLLPRFRPRPLGSNPDLASDSPRYRPSG
jgi:glycolate oxidase